MKKINDGIRRTLLNPLVVVLDYGWWSVLCIVLIELVLACFMPQNILSDAPILDYFVQVTTLVAPIINKFGARNAAHPEAVRFYLALSCWFLIPKTIALYRWLAGRRNTSLGRQLIVSPLTSTKADSVNGYVLEPMKDSSAQAAEAPKERSWFSRIFWSILIFSFAGMVLFIFLVNGSPESKTSEIRQHFIALGNGGVGMWYVQSVKAAVFSAFLLSISATVARDYLIFLNQLIGKIFPGDKSHKESA
jgi:hypothetical protein